MMIKVNKIGTLENQDFDSQVVPEYWDCVINDIIDQLQFN